MTDKSRLIDVILNDCTPNTTRKYRHDGSDSPPEANPTQHQIMVGYSLAGGYYRGLDVGKVIEEMIARKLIVEKQEGRLYTDSLGYDVLDVGGWDNYVSTIRKKEKLVSFQHKWFWFAAISTVAIPLATLSFQIYRESKIAHKILKWEQQMQHIQKKPTHCIHRHRQHFSTKTQKADTLNSKHP